MNNVKLMGRLTRNPAISYSQNGENQMAIARMTIAVDRRTRRQGESQADFISCISFGRNAEFAEKYLKQGTAIILDGHIQTGSYEKDGRRIYTTDVVVDRFEFPMSNNRQNGDTAPATNQGVQAQGGYQSGAPQGGYQPGALQGGFQPNTPQVEYQPNMTQGSYSGQQNTPRTGSALPSQAQGGYVPLPQGMPPVQGGYGQMGYNAPQASGDDFMPIPDDLSDIP